MLKNSSSGTKPGAVGRQLFLLRLVEAREHNRPLSVHCWHEGNWRPVATDANFARAFNPNCEVEDNPPDALQLDFPAGAQAVLLLPGNWVWSGLEAIPKAVRRQSSAVGFMVEDRLAEDVEDLYFLCRPRIGDLCSVYAVARDKMDALQSQLQRLHWPVVAAIPEYQLLNLLDVNISLWIDGDHAHIWHKTGYGLSVQRQHLQPLLAHLDDDEQAGEEEGSVTVELQLLGAGDSDSLAAAKLESLFGERLHRLPGTAEEELLERCRPERLDNLLTGEYQLADGTDDRNWWRKPAMVAAACFVVQLLLFVAAGSYYQWQATSAEKEAQALFSQLFPQSRPSADIRRQIEGYLNQASGGSGNFGRQMQLLSEVWEQHKGGKLKLQSLRFDGNRGEMVLQLQAANLTDLDALVGRLSGGEYRAELLAANELESGVSGRIRLR